MVIISYTSGPFPKSFTNDNIVLVLHANYFLLRVELVVYESQAEQQIVNFPLLLPPASFNAPSCNCQNTDSQSRPKKWMITDNTFLTQNTVLMLEIEFLSFVGWMIIGENKE